MTDVEKAPETTALTLVSDKVEKHKPRVSVLILQHPQEQDVMLGSARLVEASLEKSILRVGLSWASLADALGRDAVDPSRWAVLYRGSLGRNLSEAEEKLPFLLLDKKGQKRKRDAGAIEGVLILDGTWSQAKTLWWRNSWLLKLERIILHPTEPSAYGKLRKQPSNQHLSTIEAVASTLDGLGEDKEIGTYLRKVFRTLCQRARDGGVTTMSEADDKNVERVVKALEEGKPIKRARRVKKDDVTF